MLFVDLVLDSRTQISIVSHIDYALFDLHVLTRRSRCGGRRRCLDGDFLDGRDLRDGGFLVSRRDDCRLLCERGVECGGRARLGGFGVGVRLFALICACQRAFRGVFAHKCGLGGLRLHVLFEPLFLGRIVHE